MTEHSKRDSLLGHLRQHFAIHHAATLGVASGPSLGPTVRAIENHLRAGDASLLARGTPDRET